MDAIAFSGVVTDLSEISDVSNDRVVEVVDALASTGVVFSACVADVDEVSAL